MKLRKYLSRTALRAAFKSIAPAENEVNSRILCISGCGGFMADSKITLMPAPRSAKFSTEWKSRYLP